MARFQVTGSKSIIESTVSSKLATDGGVAKYSDKVVLPNRRSSP